MDIVLTKIFVVSGGSTGDAASQLTRGLVGQYTTTVLPSIQPIHTLILTLVCMFPSLYNIWKNPNAKLFLPASIHVMMCSFMCGYHIHEKVSV